MDELELRLAALELWAIEVGAWIDPQVLDDAAAAIRDGLDRAIDDDERTIRQGALGLIEDARKRFAAPAVGVALPGRDDA